MQKHISLMDEAGINKTILFSTIVHLENSTNLNQLELELNKL